MKVSTLAPGLLAGAVLAQRPQDTSICDYYTKALLKDNTAKNQATVLTLLVNTAVLGSTVPKPKIDGVTFPTNITGLDGILAPNATYMGQPAGLAHYFDGTLASSNRGGDKGVSVNFLDGGAAEPLMNAMPANDTNSNQGKLLTHLYQFFGALLKCSEQGKGNDFANYDGETNMYEVHKFMALNSSQVNYFISQVGLAAKSFGVTDDDVTAVGMALNNTFGMRCSPAAEVIPGAGKELQAICIASDCPEAMSATCDAYEAVVTPEAANATMSSSGSMASGTSSESGSMATDASSTGGMGGGMASGTSSGGATSTPSGGVAASNVGSVVAAGGIAALAFFL